jgi:TRAP-type C4-dicarboxylate transport system permease small subunit
MERRAYWLVGAALGFTASGVLIWVSASQFMAVGAAYRAGAAAADLALMRERGFFWVVASVVACGVGLGALVRYLVLRPGQRGRAEASSDGTL